MINSIAFYYYYFFLLIFTTKHIYQTKEGFIFRLSGVNVLIPRICFVQRISLLEGDATKEILKQLTRFSGTFRDSKFLFHYRYNFRTAIIIFLSKIFLIRICAWKFGLNYTSKLINHLITI